MISDLTVWSNTMRIYDVRPERLPPSDMHISNTTNLRNIGIIVRDMYTDGGLFQDNLGKGIQVS